MTRKVITLLIALAMVFALAACGQQAAAPAASGSADSGLIKVGIINLDPSESGYREANVKNLTDTFTAAPADDEPLDTFPAYLEPEPLPDEYPDTAYSNPDHQEQPAEPMRDEGL